MAAYVFVRVEKVKDPAGLHRYLSDLLPPTLEKYGGEFIARGRPLERLMGLWEPDFYALGTIRFPSTDEARQRFHSPEYQGEPKKLFVASVDVSVFLFEGIEGL